MSVSISARDLAQLAKTPDRELRIEPQDGVNVLQKNEGWFGGRLARSLKIATNSDGRATNQAKQDQYKRMPPTQYSIRWSRPTATTSLARPSRPGSATKPTVNGIIRGTTRSPGVTSRRCCRPPRAN